MSSILVRGALFATMWIGASALTASAQDYCRTNANPDLFYNYYAPGVNCNGSAGTPAQLYVSPRPVPESIGHTYITYQPLLPHEFLYPHHRTYYRCNGPDAGATTTHVKWGHNNSHHWSNLLSSPKRPAAAIFEPYCWGF